MSERTDRLEALMAEAKVLAGHIAAAQGRLAVLAGEMVALMEACGPGWGFRSPTHRLGFELGFTPAEARRLVTVAERLDELPTLAEAARAGELNLAVAAQVAQVAQPDTIDALLETNQSATAAQMQRICASYRRITNDPDPEPAQDFFSLRADGQRWRVDGSLGAADGAVLQQSLRAKRDQLFHHTGQPASTVDALMALARGEATDTGGADRFLALITIDADKHLAGQPDAAQVVGGPTLTQAEIDQILEDCSMVGVISRSGRPAWISDKSRTPPGWMRRMLRARHPTCSFPGCQAAGYLEAHHSTHYEHRRDAGVDDLVLLCTFHHRQLHTEGGRVEPLGDGQFRFIDPTGTPIEATRARPTKPDRPIEDLNGHPPRGPTTPTGDPLTTWGLGIIHDHLLTHTTDCA